MLRRVLAVGAIALVLTACKGSGDAGPQGKPDVVVARAPDITMATKSAHVLGGAPGVTATGRVNFVTGTDTMKVQGRKHQTVNPPFGVTQPQGMIDLLRGVIKVTSYGGAEVQGDGTKRYEVDIDLFKAITSTPVGPRRETLHMLDGHVDPNKKLWADVFIDGKGRIRRILIPVDTAMLRPVGQSQIEPQEVSVDYSDFGGS